MAGIMAVLKHWCDGSGAKCVDVLVNVTKKLGLE
jgi:hypothetical protein